MTGRFTSMAASACLVLLLAGCGDDTEGVGASTQGPLLIDSSRDNDSDMPGALIVGELTYKSGCIRVGDFPVAWPGGTTWNNERHELTLDSGATAEVGDQIGGDGAYFVVDDLIEYWGGPTEVDAAVQETMRECVGPTDEVAVMNPDVATVKH